MSTTVSNFEMIRPAAVTHRRTPRSSAALWEALVIAVDSIWSHKLRSFLTLLGVIIGVASVVAVGASIEGFGKYINDRLTSVFGSSLAGSPHAGRCKSGQ